MYKATIVIPNINGKGWLKDSIESVYAQTEQNFRLIVVDNGSTDESLEQARSYCSRENFTLIENGTNTGFSHAVNQGIALPPIISRQQLQVFVQKTGQLPGKPLQRQSIAIIVYIRAILQTLFRQRKIRLPPPSQRPLRILTQRPDSIKWSLSMHGEITEQQPR